MPGDRLASTAARTGGRPTVSALPARRVRVVLVALVVTLAAGTLVVHHQLFGDVTRLEGASSGLDERPALAAAGAALNILLLGVRRSDAPGDGSRSQLRWLPDATLESA